MYKRDLLVDNLDDEQSDDKVKYNIMDSIEDSR